MCSAGKFENGKITCLVPELESFNPDNLSYYVDVALNGQQFTGKPLRFRYYDISITKISPSFVSSEGGTIMKILGSGLYDSNSKRLRFTTDKGMREVAANYDKVKGLTCKVPPLTWLFGGEEVSEELV